MLQESSHQTCSHHSHFSCLFLFRRSKASLNQLAWAVPTRRGRAAVAATQDSRRICDRARLRLSSEWERRHHSKRCITTLAAVAKLTLCSSSHRTLAARWTVQAVTRHHRRQQRCPTRIISSLSSCQTRAATEAPPFHANHRPMLWWRPSNSLEQRPSRRE